MRALRAREHGVGWEARERRASIARPSPSRGAVKGSGALRKTMLEKPIHWGWPWVRSFRYSIERDSPGVAGCVPAAAA